MTAGSHLRINIEPNGCGGCKDLQTLEITPDSTSLEILDTISNLIGIRATSFVLVEMNLSHDRERVLSYQDKPYTCMLAWPRDDKIMFGIRSADLNDIVLRSNTSGLDGNIDHKAFELVKQGLLPNMRVGEPDVDDLCVMQAPISQSKVLNVLKERFLHDKIYTYSGEILISVNPYKMLPIYNPKFGHRYQNRKKQDHNPHIYAVADSAFSKMMDHDEDQCIVITGKSGSGKTQATHYLVHHTLKLCHKSYMQGVERMLSGCGPVLEALGNASTEHNNNSSRFGKFLRIYFFETGLLSGAELQAYLLEKSRLVHQQVNERNFHIFYYMLYGMEESELVKLRLNKHTAYHYLHQNLPMQREEAVANLQRLRSAMEVVGFFNGAQSNIFRLVAAILLLGNISFKTKGGRDEGLEIENEQVLEDLSELLGLNAEDVCKCLLTRRAKAGQDERLILSLKHCEALATRDAIAKALYRHLFDWMVHSMNMALAQKTKDSRLRAKSRSIGLLDIFGFEDFEHNSFEQFCINYASEHLQNYCLQRTFKTEQELYKLEGLEWKEIEYADNSGCIALYEQKQTGLFYLIDDKIAFPGSNDITLLNQYNHFHASNKYYEQPRTKEDAFIIRHFAGRVKYRIADFHQKNHDQVRENVVQLLRTTRSSFVQEVTSKSRAAIFRWSVLRALVRSVGAFCDTQKKPGVIKSLTVQWPPSGESSRIQDVEFVHKKLIARLVHRRPTDQEQNTIARRRNASNNGKTKKKVNSISQQYQASLAALMSALEKANPFFVRCIQPNTAKVAGKIDDELMLHQLRCSGTLQTIEIQQTRFAQHYDKHAFYQRYKLLMKKKPETLADIDQVLQEILPKALLIRKPKPLYQLGRNEIFLHEPICRYLHLTTTMKRVHCIIKVQAYVRGYLERSRYTRMVKSAIKIQSFFRMVSVQREIEYFNLAASVIQDAWRKHKARQSVESSSYDLHLSVQMDENQAAQIIQAQWRKYRKQQQKQQHEQEERAAWKIQNCFRSWLIRKKAQVERKRRKLSLEISSSRLHYDVTTAAANNKQNSNSMVSLFSKPESPVTVQLPPPPPSLDVLLIDEQQTNLVNAFTSEPTTSTEVSEAERDDVITSAGDVFLRAVYPSAAAQQRHQVESSSSESDDVSTASSSAVAPPPPHVRPLAFEPSKRKIKALIDHYRGNQDDVTDSMTRHGKYDLVKKENNVVKVEGIAFIDDVDDDVPPVSVGDVIIAEAVSDVDDMGLLDDDVIVAVNETATVVLHPEPLIEATVKEAIRLGAITRGHDDDQVWEFVRQFLAFQRLEHDRSKKHVEKPVESRSKKSNKKERKLSAEWSELRLEHMSFLNKKAEELGIEVNKIPLPDFDNTQRRRSSNSDNNSTSGRQRSTSSEDKSPIQSPKSNPLQRRESRGRSRDSKSTLHLPPSMTLQQQVNTSAGASIRSHSLESMKAFSRRTVPTNLPTQVSSTQPGESPSSRPKRRRSNSAIENYSTSKQNADDDDNGVRLRKNSSPDHGSGGDSVTSQRKSVPSSTSASTRHSQHLETPKRGGVGMRLRNFFGQNEEKNVNHKNGKRKTIPTPNSSLDNLTEEAEMKVKSREVEALSDRILVTTNEQLDSLDKFIGAKADLFGSKTKVDSVFADSLRQLRDRLLDMFTHNMNTQNDPICQLRFADIVAEFKNVLNKNVEEHEDSDSLGSYAFGLAVNGFRSYLDEFLRKMESDNKHKKKKKEKENEKGEINLLGHRITHTNWSVVQYCEYCTETMYVMDPGYFCSICMFVCHKKCIPYIINRCKASDTSEKPHKLLGEKLFKLADNDIFLPLFIEKACCYIEKEGVSIPGIYRKSSGKSDVMKFISTVNKDYQCEKVNFDDFRIHTVTSCIKNFLRQLPTPVCPNDIFMVMNNAARLTDEKERLDSCWSNVRTWPREHQAILERLIFHFIYVSQFEHLNKMNSTGMAVIFAPTIFILPKHYELSSDIREIKPFVGALRELIEDRKKDYVCDDVSSEDMLKIGRKILRQRIENIKNQSSSNLSEHGDASTRQAMAALTNQNKISTNKKMERKLSTKSASNKHANKPTASSTTAANFRWKTAAAWTRNFNNKTTLPKSHTNHKQRTLHFPTKRQNASTSSPSPPHPPSTSKHQHQQNTTHGDVISQPGGSILHLHQDHRRVNSSTPSSGRRGSSTSTISSGKFLSLRRKMPSIVVGTNRRKSQPRP